MRRRKENEIFSRSAERIPGKCAQSQIYISGYVYFGGILMALYTEVGPTANSKSVLDPFFELFAILCPLIGIFAAMDSVVGEKEKGTLELVLSKPISRTNLLFGKFVTYVLIIVPLLVAELVIA